MGCLRCGKTGFLPEIRTQPFVLDEPTGPLPFIDPPEGYAAFTNDEVWNSETFSAPRDYLLGRGIDRHIMALAGIGACASGHFAGRIIIPVRDAQLRWVGFSSRAWVKGVTPTYKYPEGEWRGRVLYNGACLHQASHDPVLVVEGVMDTFPFWPDAVALLGKVSMMQWDLLLATQRPLVIVLDGDAWREAQAMTLRLRFEGLCAGWVKLPPKIDPDEVDRDWLLWNARCSLMEDV